MSGEFDDLLEGNRAFAGTYDLAGLEPLAARGLAVVTCMDSRINPLEALGLQPGDAKILRNAGARVTEDVLRTLVLAVHLLAVDRVLVMPHTQCKMASADEPTIHAEIERRWGVDTRSLEFRTTGDQVGSLREDLVRIRSYPLLPDTVAVGGAIYDVDTGLLTPVDLGRVMTADHSCDLLIVGAGPAGLYAAYYAGFRGWTSIVMDTLPEPGGQVSAMYPEKDIFDVAGFPSVKGRVLVENLVAQAGTYGPTYLLGHQAITLETSEEGPVCVTSARGLVVEAKAVLITGGIGSFTPRPLPAGDGWDERGVVSFVPRLAEHEGRDIVIVGGGDSAFDWALMLHPVARSVHLVHRRDAYRAHAGTVDAVKALGVELHPSSDVVALHPDPARADGWVGSVEIESRVTHERAVLPAQTVVAALGFIAAIGPMAEWGLELDHRRIVVDPSMRTTLPRVFGAGDIVTYPGKVPLISVGFGEAAVAVNNAAPYIDPHAHVFPGHSSGGSAE